MARSEARIAVSIWDDGDFLALDPDAQRMFLFLCSQQDLAHDGVIALRERRWSKKAAGLTLAQVVEALGKLEQARFVVIDEDTEELLVRSFIRRDKVFRQPNVLRSAADHLVSVTSPAILRALAAELERISASSDVPPSCVAILAEMRATVRKGSGKGSQNAPTQSSAATGEAVDNSTRSSTNRAASTTQSAGMANPSEPDTTPVENAITAGAEGSNNPSAEGIGGTPGERGMSTTVTTDSPFPEPLASDPPPRPSAGAPASARDATADPRRTPPPERCPKHLDDPDPPPCGRCAGARKAHAKWQAAEVARLRNAPKCTKHRGQLAHNCASCRADQLAAEEA